MTLSSDTDDEADDADQQSESKSAPSPPSEEELRLFREGMRCFQQSDVKRAIQCFDKLVALDDKSCDAYMYRGACYYHLRDAQNTLADYERLVRISPKTPSYWCVQCACVAFLFFDAQSLRRSCLGDAYMNLTDQVDEALRCYERCLSLDPKFAAAYYNRGICSYKKKKVGSWNEPNARRRTKRKESLTLFFFVFVFLFQYEQALNDLQVASRERAARRADLMANAVRSALCNSSRPT